MSKYNEIKAALLGAGTVGGGVYKLIEKRKSEMPSMSGKSRAWHLSLGHIPST